jgi:hypothetical protein
VAHATNMPRQEVSQGTHLKGAIGEAELSRGDY